MIAYTKPTAADSKKARNLLKEAGIKINVKKSLRTVYIGRQGSLLDRDVAVKIISVLSANGFAVSMPDVVSNLIKNGICDTMSFYVLA